MLEGKRLRCADFITSILLILFGIWMLFETVKMPMRDTFGGVTNVWYVSPALFPFFISVSVMVLGSVLLIRSVVDGGARYLFEKVTESAPGVTEENARFIVILLSLVSFVYLFIPRIDFFLSVVIFLVFFISAFYFDGAVLLRQLGIFYFAGCAFLLVLFATGAGEVMNRMFSYAMDVFSMLFLLFYVLYMKHLIRHSRESKRRFLLVLLVAFLLPALLCPVFKYVLFVPLPTEGIIIEIMNHFRYTL